MKVVVEGVDVENKNILSFEIDDKLFGNEEEFLIYV